MKKKIANRAMPSLPPSFAPSVPDSMDRDVRHCYRAGPAFAFPRADSLTATESTSQTSTLTGPQEYTRGEFPDGDLVRVIVQKLEQTLKVWVIPQDPGTLQRLEQLKGLLAKIQVEAPSQPLLQHKTLNSACVALFNNGKWCRAIVLQDNGTTLQVMDADSSHQETISADRVRECRPEWMALPTSAHEADLPSLKTVPSSLSEAGMKALRQALVGNTFTARVQLRVPQLELELYFEGTTTSVLESLAGKGVL